MAWSSAFLAALNSRTATPVFHLGVVDGLSGLPGRWQMASAGTAPGWGVISDVRVEGAQLQLLDWTCSFGGFSVDFATNSPHLLLPQIVRGQIVALSVQFEGTGLEVVAVGMVRNVSGVGGSYTVECSDFLSALGSRNTQTLGELALFAGLDDVTTLDADYTVGDTTVTVVNSTGFDREDSASGLIWIHPPSGGDPFALTYTGKTSTTFTGVSTAGVAGTTARNVATGGDVTEGAWIHSHPIEMVLKVLTSTGTAAANGDYDTLPRTWAYGIPREFVDTDDASLFVAQSQPLSGSDAWTFAVATPQTDGFGWIQQVVYLGGYFLCPRQGGITVRCVQDPESAREQAHIHDYEIEEIEWSAYDPNYPVEYAKYRTLSADGTPDVVLDHDVGSLPAEELYENDLGGLASSNETAIRAEVNNRLTAWYTRIPEALTIRCAGRQFARLAPGDRVGLSTTLATGRLESTTTGYERRSAIVLRVDPGWMENNVRLVLAVLPTYAEALVA